MSNKFYESEETIYILFNEFFNRLLVHPVASKLLETKIIMEVIISDFNAYLILDTLSSPPKLMTGKNENNPKPDVTMIMNSNTTHKFWMGQINLAWALLTKDIIARGSIEKVIKILPLLKPTFQIYKEIVCPV